MKNRKDLVEKSSEYNLEYAKGHEKKNPLTYGEFKEVIKLYIPSQNEKVLEIGCNTGEFCGILKEKYNLDPEGIDINEEAIKIARMKYPSIKFHVSDFFDLVESYDVIYLQQVIEHLKEPEKAFLKLYDLLNPGGKIIITCPNKWAYISKIICRIKNEKFCFDPTHVSEFNPKELSHLIKKAGFNILKVKTRPGFPFIFRISITLHYMIPSYIFGDFIFLLGEKTIIKIFK